MGTEICVVVEIDLMSLSGMKLELISVYGLNLVVVWVVKNDLIFVSELKLTRFLCRGIEIDLILEWGSN